MKAIGKIVCGIVDRPMGSHHLEYAYMVYPVNNGNVDSIFAGDGEEQDVYILGEDGPLHRFEGMVIAIYHRYSDKGDK